MHSQKPVVVLSSAKWKDGSHHDGSGVFNASGGAHRRIIFVALGHDESGEQLELHSPEDSSLMSVTSPCLASRAGAGAAKTTLLTTLLPHLLRHCATIHTIKHARHDATIDHDGRR